MTFQAKQPCQCFFKATHYGYETFQNVKPNLQNRTL